jgi:CRISPR type I-E-associated protein CasB/Cse2
MNEKNQNHEEEFLRRLVVTVGGEGNRGTRAELRRYWSLTTRHYATMQLAKLGALRSYLNPEALLALLYAEHPEHRQQGSSLGRALLTLAGGSAQSSGFEAFERHFRRLLACEGGDLNELSTVLHRFVKRLSKESIPLDYNKLLWDLRKWHTSSEEVKTQWTRSFYNSPSPETLRQGFPEKSS